MPDNSIPVIAFDNQLAYDVIVYDSYDYDEDDQSSNTADSQSYFATLTQLGKVPAGKTVTLQPIHDSSAFVVENATDNKPIKRLVALLFDDITSLSIMSDDEAAMTETFQFVTFFLNNPNDTVSVAFNKVLNDTTGDLATGIDHFFAAEPAYNKCCFEDYMMALAYAALHPQVPNPSQPAGSSSLKIISKLMGSNWADALADIFVTKFSITTKDKRLVLTFEIDISSLTFESADIAANVLTMMNGTKMVKAQIFFNYAIGLNILGTRLSLQLDAMKIPVGDGKTLSITKPAASIDINPLFKFVVFTLEATFPFNVQGKTFDALASFVIDNDEAAIGVDIKGDKTSFPAPPGLKGLFFDEFGVGMGLFFKPPGFGVGIEGKFHIGSGNQGLTLADNSFAMVCEFLPDAVEPKYLSFYVPQLNLNQVVQLFTNVNPQIDIPVNFSDLFFHWSDGLMDAVALPDGTLSPAGYGFRAAVDIFSFGFYGEANLDINTGLSANLEVSPVNWKNIFKLEGDGKGFSLKYDTKGDPIPPNFVPNTPADKAAVANATLTQVVAPGGPCLVINTLSMPILHLNATASLFDLIDYSITADINKDGISFELDYGAILTQQMSCRLADFHNFYAQFGYSINRSIPLPSIAGQSLGSIPLVADAALHFSMLTSLTDIQMSVGGNFDFEGYHFSFGDFTGDISITKISDFIESIIQYIIKEAKSIFSPILNTAESWAKSAGKGIVKAADSVGKTLKNAYNVTANNLPIVMKAAGYAGQDIMNSLRNDYSAASDTLAAIMKAAGYSADEIGLGIKNVWNCGIDDVSWALKQAGFSVNEVGHASQQAFKAESQQVAATLKKWGYKVEDIGGSIKNIWNCGVDDVTWALGQVGFSADQITSSLRSTFGSGAQDVINSLKKFGHTYNEIANVLKNDFACDVRTANTYLKNLGYTASQIVDVLRNIYNLVYLDCTLVLHDIGILSHDAAVGLQNVWGAAAQDIGTGFRMVGYIANDTANTLRSVYNLAIDQTASVMKQAGYAANDVASALQGAFNTSVEAVANAMKDVGYAANDVKKAFDELGGDFKSFGDTAWGDVKHYLNPSHW